MKRRYPPKRKSEALLRRGREAQAPAGWVPIGELALRLAGEAVERPEPETLEEAKRRVIRELCLDMLTDARGDEKRTPEETPPDDD